MSTSVLVRLYDHLNLGFLTGATTSSVVNVGGCSIIAMSDEGADLWFQRSSDVIGVVAIGDDGL